MLLLFPNCFPLYTAKYWNRTKDIILTDWQNCRERRLIRRAGKAYTIKKSGNSCYMPHKTTLLYAFAISKLFSAIYCKISFSTQNDSGLLTENGRGEGKEMLTLPTIGKWFYMILSGEKGEEYRDIKLYFPYFPTSLPTLPTESTALVSFRPIHKEK